MMLRSPVDATVGSDTEYPVATDHTPDDRTRLETVDPSNNQMVLGSANVNPSRLPEPVTITVAFSVPDVARFGVNAYSVDADMPNSSGPRPKSYTWPCSRLLAYRPTAGTRVPVEFSQYTPLCVTTYRVVPASALVMERCLFVATFK